MAMRIETGQRVPEVRRVAALSASFFLHAAAALVIALPLAPVVRRAPPPVEVAVLHQEAPPPPPVPPEPQPPAVERPHPHARPAPLHAKSEPVLPVATDVSPMTEAPRPSGAVAASTAAQGPATDAVSGAGEDRALAWSTPLKLRYPVASLRQHEQGRVLLHVLVDSDGAVQRIEIVRGSGHPALDAAARAAVQEARFQPVLRDGHAVAAWGLVPIEFRLDRG